MAKNTHSKNQLRAELNSRGAAGMSKLAQRLREATASFGTTGSCRGVDAGDFRQAMRETELPFTEADVRRIFAHFEVRCQRVGDTLGISLQQ